MPPGEPTMKRSERIVDGTAREKTARRWPQRTNIAMLRVVVRRSARRARHPSINASMQRRSRRGAVVAGDA